MALSPGQTLGQYRILSELGAGGMGVVYKAEQPAVRRTVAVKVLSANFANDPEALERFRREVDIIAQLEHPHILPVYDFGEVEGSPYIVMRYMAGGSLLDGLRSQSLTQAQLLRILEQVADALDYAHARDIVHRDLKPHNVLLDEGGNAYLADFGLAKTLEGSRDLTKTGLVMGTPAYMSPEQARGEKLDPRSDVYSFGVLAYQALAGQLPFNASTAMEFIAQHLSAAPVPILSVAPHLPPAVDEVLCAALAKNRSERPARASDLSRALAAILAPGSLPGQPQFDGPASRAASRAGTGAASRGASSPAAPAASAAAGKTAAAPLSQPAAPAAPAMAGGAPTTALPRPTPRPQGRAGWLLPAAALGLGGGLVAVVAVVLVAVLALRGGLSRPEVTTISVGDSPRAVLYDGESVWVAGFYSNSITQLATADGAAVNTYAVDDLPVGLASDGQYLWIASSLNRVLTQLDPASGAIVAEYTLPHVPSALQLADDYLWTANAFAGTISKVSLDGEVLGSYAVGQSPVALAYGEETLWVANQTDGTVMQLDPANGSLLTTYSVGEQPTALAFAGGRLWVALGEANEVVALEPADGSVTARVEVGERPLALLFDGVSLWSADQDSNTITRLDVERARRLTTVTVPGGPYALTWSPCGAGCRDVWVAGESGDTVSRVRVQDP